jgi:hypothetical protein
VRARIVENSIEIVPSSKGERELLSRIVSLSYEPVTDILTDGGNVVLTNLRKIKLRFKLSEDGTEFADATIET